VLLDQHLEFAVQPLEVFAQITQPTIQQVQCGTVQIGEFVRTVLQYLRHAPIQGGKALWNDDTELHQQTT
jgi:hypothetical protein